MIKPTNSNTEVSQIDNEINVEANALSRRGWLKKAGGAALLLPVVHLAGCSDAAEPKVAPKPAAAAPKPKPAATVSAPAAETAAKTVADAVPAAAPGAGSLVKIDSADPMGKALKYTANAADVDKAANPRFKAGQNCSNCAQYKAVDEDGWGSCAIFPGKLVAAEAWCSAYAAVS